MVRAFGDSLTWGTNEILTLQLIRETMARTGLPLDEAISEVGKHMPNYRIPPRVLNSRLISAVMRNPMLTLWGHYHYGALRSYGEIGKELMSPTSTGRQRIDALGRIGSIAFLMAVAYPAIDKLINEVMGTKGLKMRRAGPTTLPQNIIDVVMGKKKPESAAQSIVTPSPVPTAALELLYNRDLRSGVPIYERRLGTQTLKDIGSFAAQKLSPVEEGVRLGEGQKSLKEFGLGLAGVSRTRADTAIARFGRVADTWMRNSQYPSVKEEYLRRSKDVFAERDYQNLRSAVIRQDHRASQLVVNKLLATHEPEQIYSRIEAWKNSPFTGTRDSDDAMMSEMGPEVWDLWYEAAQERLDIANEMEMSLAEALTKRAGPSRGQ
jgi:hypothetical protein